MIAPPNRIVRSALLHELVIEQGEVVARRVSGVLGISRHDAAKVLPATASVILDRFEPGTSGRNGADPHPVEASDPGRSLDGILAGTGLQLSERLGATLRIAPEEAARTIPLLVPVILRFILKRIPYVSLASSLLGATVARQGDGSLDALARRLADHATSRSAGGAPVQPSPVVTAYIRNAGLHHSS